MWTGQPQCAASGSYDYDIKNDCFIGNSTLPGHTGTASKAMVWQIASIGGRRYKQVNMMCDRTRPLYDKYLTYTFRNIRKESVTRAKVFSR